MADGSSIEWTDATWNPVRGCTKVSPGCKHCYAETFAERFRGVPDHPFQVLTKRSERMAALSAKLDIANNVCMGVSVESQKYTTRIDDLRRVDAPVRFLSIEPLL